MIDNLKQIIFFIVFLAVWISILILGVKKCRLHFKLLKELFPSKLQGVKSYFQLMWLGNYLKLDPMSMLWIATPIYFSRNKKFNFKDKALEYHNKLLKLNRVIFRLLLLFMIVWLFEFLM